jgi:hypothetical protein
MCVIRHPEVAAKRPSKGDGPGRASFEARFRSHLRMTELTHPVFTTA